MVLVSSLSVISDARAQAGSAEAEERTYLQFSAPIALPGTTLGTGKYLFKRADVNTPDVIQVFDATGTKLYGMWLTARSERRDPTDQPEVRFIETPEKAPHAVRSWYYPQRRMGHEFIYTKEQATRLARASGEPVLMTESTATDAATMQKAEVKTVSPTGEITPFRRNTDGERQAPIARADTPPPASASTATASAAPADRAPASVGTAGQASSQPARPRRQSLPQTSSNLWLVGMVALVSLAAGVSLRMLAARL